MLSGERAPQSGRPATPGSSGTGGTIPREFELAADEVIIYHEDDRLVVEPVPRAPTLATVLSRLTRLDEDFPPIADPPVRPEDTL